MTKHKKKDNSFTLILGILGFVFFIFFLINSLIINHYYSKKYNIHSASTRVTDSANIVSFIPIIFTLSGSLGMGLFLLHGNAGLFFLIAITLILFSITGMILLSARIGIAQIGLLIFKDQDMFIIPADFNQNSFFQNFFQLKIFKSMFLMEELPLTGIYKITREVGKKAFIHGSFGTRSILWRNKQKRDECIAALEIACGKKLSSFDSGN